MREPLQALRRQMQAAGVDAYLIPTSDFHGSEYMGGHFTGRAYVSGFTGSAGTLLVLEDWAGLWTDGRYFLQAEEQLQDTGIQLMKVGEPGVPGVGPFLTQRLKRGQVLAYDGRCVSAREGMMFARRAQWAGAVINDHLDLLDLIWPDRPPLSAQPVWELDLPYAGFSRREKLKQVRAIMERQKATVLLVTSLEDAAWLLNLRGGDIECCPLFLSYVVLTDTQAILFANKDIFSPALLRQLEDDGVTLAPYEEVYEYVKQLPPSSRAWLDPRKVNRALAASLPRGQCPIQKPSPIELLRAVKNPTEIENLRRAHLYDGVALTRFILWIRAHAGQDGITERSAAEFLEEKRQEMPHYLGPSFAPILAYGPHGAIVHYSATPESDAAIGGDSFLLADTGGHYLEGTTDCTRTIALGPLTMEQKQHYTAVLRGNLNLMAAQFPAGCTGPNIDILARAPLWELGLDFNHGTGHGVGYLLSVHEGPQRIHSRSLPGQPETPFQAGMVTSDEPGYYLEGQYGIRLENLLLCVERKTAGQGTFLGFEPLTWVPFDLEAIDPLLLSPKERSLLNDYHAKVREKLSPFLTPEEKTALVALTRPIA